jgi:hypothetical protein
VRIVAKSCNPGAYSTSAPAFEGLQAPDRIIEVGPAADQVLRPRDKGKRHRQRVRDFGAGCHSLDCVIETVDALTAPILDRAADNTHFSNIAQNRSGFLRVVGVAVFQVGIDRQVGRLGDDTAILQKLGARHRALGIDPTKGVRHAEAGRCQRLEAERCQQFGGAGIPRIGQDQNSGPRMQFPEQAALLGLRAHFISHCPSLPVQTLTTRKRWSSSAAI